MELVAFLGNDKETWAQVNALVRKGEWDKVILVKSKTSDFFPETEKCETITFDCTKSLMDLKQNMTEKLKEKLKGDFEVALSLASGNGKEHMSLLSALLSIPVGVRLVVFTQKGIEFVN